MLGELRKKSEEIYRNRMQRGVLTSWGKYAGKARALRYLEEFA